LRKSILHFGQITHGQNPLVFIMIFAIDDHFLVASGDEARMGQMLICCSESWKNLPISLEK